MGITQFDLHSITAGKVASFPEPIFQKITCDDALIVIHKVACPILHRTDSGRLLTEVSSTSLGGDGDRCRDGEIGHPIKKAKTQSTFDGSDEMWFDCGLPVQPFGQFSRRENHPSLFRVASTGLDLLNDLLGLLRRALLDQPFQCRNRLCRGRPYLAERFHRG